MSQLAAAHPEVWVLADDRPGNVGQCLGVAEALGLPFEIKDIRYTRAGALPNLMRGSSLLGLSAEARRGLVPPWPRLVIAAGRRTAPVARWLKRQSGCLLAQLMDPGPPGRDDFDLIAVPAHDRRPPVGANVMRVVGAAHRVTAAKLATAAAHWRPALGKLAAPRVALIVGGAAKGHGFRAEHAALLAEHVARMIAETGGSLMITTSRRTGRAAEEALLARLPAAGHLFRWGDAGENPYLGYVAVADAIVVTGDSVSMVCEAAAGTAPVYVFAPPGMVGAKHARLLESLYAGGYARPLQGTFEPWTHPPLNAAPLIAERLQAMLAGQRAA